MMRFSRLSATSAARAAAARRAMASSAAEPGPVSDPDKEPRFLEMVKMYFDRAAALTDLDKGLLEVIKGCNSVLRVAFPLRRDDGRIEVRI